MITKRCHRHKVPFFRKDHFRDHITRVHWEYLPAHGKEDDSKWWSEMIVQVWV